MIQQQTGKSHTELHPVPHTEPQVVRPTWQPDVLDPFHADPPEPLVTRQRVALIVAALLLGVGATALTLALGSDQPTPGAFVSAEPAADLTVAGVSTPVPSASVPPVAGPSAGNAVGSGGAVVGTGSAGTGSSGTGSSDNAPGSSTDPAPGSSTDPDPDPDPDPEPDPEPIETNVEITSPGGGHHTAGTPLYLEATAQSPLSGNYLPGAVLHWTVKRGGTLVFSGLGSSATVHGVHMTQGAYSVRVEVQAESYTGSDAVTVTVPFDLAPNPPDPTPNFTPPTDELAAP